MRARNLLVIGILASSIAIASTALAEVELKNDGFMDGDSVGFQSGFVTGEMGASRFTPPAAGVGLLKVQILFGGGVDGAKQDVILHVWDDPTGDDAPGMELFTGQYSLTAADTALQELLIPGEPVVVDGPFRVGVEVTAAGLPSIARDSDGTILADANFINGKGIGWKRSNDLGVNGDWIIRAFVEDGAGGSGAGGGTGTTAGAGGAGTTTSTTSASGSGGAGGSEPPPTAGTQGGLCSCRAVGAAPMSGEALFFSLLGATALTARRRRRSAQHERQ